MEKYIVSEVHTQNLRNLVDVRFTPSERIVKISGKNGSGKSSIIESIFLGLCGTKTIERGIDQSMLVRNGEKEATIEITISGPRTIKVTRKITSVGNSSVEFRSSDGTKLYQKDVDEVLSLTSVDPMQIIRMNEKEQTLFIKNVTGLDTTDIDDKINEKNGTLYLQRTEQGKRKREAEAVLSDMGDIAPGERVETSQILKQWEEIKKHNSDQDMIHERIANGNMKIQREEDAIKEIEEQIRQLENNKTSKRQQINGYMQAIKELNATIAPKKDEEEMSKKISEAETINTNAEAFEKWVKQNDIVQRETVDYQSINEEIKALTEQKLERIRKVNMPISGMELDEDKGILIDGLSMKHQYNTAKQIEFAMRIVLSANPQLRLVYIKDGSLLDQDILEIICEQATQMDAQVFIERVGEEIDTIIMRDGVMIS